MYRVTPSVCLPLSPIVSDTVGGSGSQVAGQEARKAGSVISSLPGLLREQGSSRIPKSLLPASQSRGGPRSLLCSLVPQHALHFPHIRLSPDPPPVVPDPLSLVTIPLFLVLYPPSSFLMASTLIQITAISYLVGCQQSAL